MEMIQWWGQRVRRWPCMDVNVQAGEWDSRSMLLQGHKAWRGHREDEREPEGLALARTGRTKCLVDSIDFAQR